MKQNFGAKRKKNATAETTRCARAICPSTKYVQYCSLCVYAYLSNVVSLSLSFVCFHEKNSVQATIYLPLLFTSCMTVQQQHHHHRCTFYWFHCSFVRFVAISSFHRFHNRSLFLAASRCSLYHHHHHNGLETIPIYLVIAHNPPFYPNTGVLE